MLFNKGKQTRYLNRVTRNCLKLNKKTQTKLASSLTSIKKGLNCNMHIGVFFVCLGLLFHQPPLYPINMKTFIRQLILQ